jgi:dihydroxyacetone kinase
VNHRFEQAARSAALAAVECADTLNELDGWAGDGDLGVTMTTAARTVLELLPTLKSASVCDVLRTCGAAVAREAPSTSGTLVATGLLRASRALAGGESGGAVDVGQALEAALVGIAERGGAEPGAKTMLDALAPATEAAIEAVSREQAVEDVLAAAAAAADDGARATIDMQPRHGRAGWLAERSAGHEDAGARLVAIVLAAAAASLAGDRFGAST